MSARTCWSCGGGLAAGDALCPSCAKVQPPAPAGASLDKFALLGLEPSFDEPPGLDEKFRALSRKLHPDRFARATPRERRYSLEQTTLLNDALFKSSESRLHPLLILEAQRAPGDSATVQQMLLRNTFASELFRLGNTSAVIAGGLLEHVSDRTAMLRVLAEGLSMGECLGRAVSRMNQRSYEIAGGKAILLIQSPVLFTDNPSFSLLPMD